jgi:hypothetical protein
MFRVSFFEMPPHLAQARHIMLCKCTSKNTSKSFGTAIATRDHNKHGSDLRQRNCDFLGKKWKKAHGCGWVVTAPCFVHPLALFRRNVPIWGRTAGG